MYFTLGIGAGAPRGGAAAGFHAKFTTPSIEARKCVARVPSAVPVARRQRKVLWRFAPQT